MGLTGQGNSNNLAAFHKSLTHLRRCMALYDCMLNAQGQRQRLHQEDFCHALGVVPEMKYQNEGGPDLAQCFDLVRRATRQELLVAVFRPCPRSGAVLRFAFNSGVPQPDAKDGHENRKQIQVQRSPGTALGAVHPQRRTVLGPIQAAHSDNCYVTAHHCAQTAIGR